MQGSRGAEQRRPDLAELAAQYGADKLQHGYCRWYETYFGARRDDPLSILEIGVGGYQDPAEGGASLRMWRDYFPNALIVGIDVWPKQLDLGARVTVLKGSQTDASFLRQVSRDHGPFDVIIDDGCHGNRERNLSFEVLFGAMADDGIYVLEDLHTSYLEVFYGGNNRPQVASPASGRSTTDRIKGLVDGLNHRFIPNWEPQPFDGDIVGVSVHPKIAFVRKGRNDPRPNPVDRAAIDAETSTASRPT